MNAMRYMISMSGVVLVALLWTTVARGEEAFSPRGFCEASGGAVLETGDPDIHICCYAARQRCLAVSNRSHTSVRVIFPDDSSNALPGMGRELDEYALIRPASSLSSAETGLTGSAPQ